MRRADWSPDGTRVLYEDGSGGVRLRNVVIGADVEVQRGWGPSWRDNDTYVFFTDDGVFDSTGAKLYPHRVSELAAGGGRWGARDGQGRLIVDGKPFAENAGQPFFDVSGHIIFTTKESILNPTRLGTLSAWRNEDRKGVDTSWGHFYPDEGYPRLIDAGPQGQWLLTMTGDTLRWREVETHEGYEIPTGENRNLEPDGVAREGALWAACSSGIYRVEFSAPRKTFTEPAPHPQPEPEPEPEPEPPPMSTPNRLDVVRDEFRKHPPAANSTESCGEFTRRVARRLHAEDPNWGMLTKNPGEGQYDGYAVDAIIYKPTQQVIDIIGGAEGPNPQPAWQEVPKRDSNHWAVPPDASPIPPVPPLPPEQPLPDLSGILARLGALESSVIRRGDSITLAADNGRYVCADQGRSKKDAPLLANRGEPGPWEHFTIDNT